jgi:hypothetical protein
MATWMASSSMQGEHVATPRELLAMNAWADQVANMLESSIASLRERITALSNFSTSNLPRATHSLPVLYLFSGSDLITAHALFAASPEYHLVADFPVGHPSCFLDAACASQANASTVAFFKHWAALRFARQSTNLMRRTFERVGQLPALLVLLRLMGQPVIHATVRDGLPPSLSPAPKFTESADQTIAARPGGSSGGASGAATGPVERQLAERTTVASNGTKAGFGTAARVVIPSITLHTARCRVAYYSLLLKSDPSENVRLSKQDWPAFKRWERGGAYVDAQLDALSAALNPARPQLEGGGSSPRLPPRLMVSMFKAAPHWILRNRWMAAWVLEHSAATLHDETGLRPRVYNASEGLVSADWQMVRRGYFAEFENREVSWYPGEKAELKAFFQGPELPFQFGYAQQGGLGVLLAAWRRDVLR